LEIKAKLRDVLSQRTVEHLHDPERRPSAVLIPIYFQQGQYFILFTKRTELVHHHKGEISFPGGGYHPEDGDLLTTALRESSEEIGLAPEDVEILGELDDTFTRGSPFIITPFVGSILPDYKFKISDFEIAEIIQIPVAALLTEGCRQELPLVEVNHRLVVPFTYAYQNHLIVGATARIVKQFLEIFAPIAGLPVPRG
jgi:8-oxo-dGTP pyrophosphatase MutT (NUDIX family)